MERNNHHPPARPKRFITALQELLELLQFLIHSDSQCLENLRRRMVIAPTPAFYALDKLDKLCGCL